MGDEKGRLFKVAEEIRTESHCAEKSPAQFIKVRKYTIKIILIEIFRNVSPKWKRSGSQECFCSFFHALAVFKHLASTPHLSTNPLRCTKNLDFFTIQFDFDNCVNYSLFYQI